MSQKLPPPPVSKKKSSPPNEESDEFFQISVSEFNRLQQQMVGLKNEAFENMQKFTNMEKRYRHDIGQYKATNSRQEKDIYRLRLVIKRSKNKVNLHNMEQEVQKLKREKENSKNLYMTQNDALKKNVQLLLKENGNIKMKLSTVQKEKEGLEMKLVNALESKPQTNLESQNTSSEPNKSKPPENGDISQTKKPDEIVKNGDSSAPKSSNEKSATEVRNILIKTINGMKSKHEQYRKSKDVEVDNLKQQNRVWQKKNGNLSEENEKYKKSIKQLQYRNKVVSENFEKEKQRWSGMETSMKKNFAARFREQAEKLQVKEAEIRNRSSIEMKKLETNLKRVIKEEEKKLQRLLRKKNLHKKKKNESRFQVNELNKVIISLRKEKQMQIDKIVALEKSIGNFRANSENVQKLKDTLKSNRTYLEKYKHENTKLIDQVNSKRKMLERCDHEKLVLVRKQNALNYEIMKFETECVFYSVLLRIERENFHDAQLKYENFKEKFETELEKSQKMANENEKLAVSLGDKEKELIITRKQDLRKIKELQIHVKNLRKKQEEMKFRINRSSGSGDELIPTSKDLKRARVLSEAKLGIGVQHSRTLSNISNTSVGSVDDSKKVNKYIDELQRDNEAIVRKLAEKQQLIWDLESRVQILDGQVLKLHEDLTNKGMIVKHYIRREKMGRLTPEMERNKKYISRKRGSLVGKLFGKSPSKSGSLSNEGLDEFQSQMQRVVEETLLKNIQIQRDMKVMGEEVDRLLKINKFLKQNLKERNETGETKKKPQGKGKK